MTGRVVAVPLVVLMLGALAAPAFAAPSARWDPVRASAGRRGHVLHRGPRGERDVNVCSEAVRPGVAHCDAHIRTDLLGKGLHPLAPRAVTASATSSHANGNAAVGNGGAYDPAYLQSAYNAPSLTKGTGETVAVVDAYDAPKAESDLAAYRSRFGLPACTTANGCFEKIDENGGTNYPAYNHDWAEEISLDVDMVSALCPNCRILLVEAASANMSDLGAAVNEAVVLGADVVSNSYGSSEWSGETAADAAFYDHPGIAIVASAGDYGYGVEYPAASPDVIAVGGTSLVQTTNTGTRNGSETVWSGTGSGCSAMEPKPAWQTDTGCSNRTVSDVSAVADPSTGVWVYDSSGPGWSVFGGTSVAAPIISAMYALAGNPATTDNVSSYPYVHATAFNDVLLGTNGSCGASYLCNGAVGYDGPTGLGTPNTAFVFTPAGSSPTPPDPTSPGAGPPSGSAAPDFALTASAVGALKPGATAKSTVTLTPENGFSGNIAVSTKVGPTAGLTVGASTASIALAGGVRSSMLTLAAKTGGTYTVTITATQGALVHTTSLKVAVNDFSIQVTPAKTSVVRGRQIRCSVTLKSAGSFSSAVTLSVSGMRTHDTVAFAHNPASVSSTQTVTITTSTRDARGTLTLRFTGVGGSLTHSVSVVLTIQ
jgi:hypothetical protein